MNPVLWGPFIKKIFNSHGIDSSLFIKPGLAGTYPTFIVNEHWVIKFFGRLFEGQQSFQVEKTVTELVNLYQPLPSASILFHGILSTNENLPWPYLVYKYIPGIAISTILDDVSFTDMKHLAAWLGRKTRLLHEMPINKKIENILPKQAILVNTDISSCIQKQIEWGFLPRHLIDQIPHFLEATREMELCIRPQNLIHADITSDHILGDYTAGSWKTLALIDFGDAMIGNLEYELIPVHLDIFKQNKKLLREFIDGYGKDLISIEILPSTCLRQMLLHRFPILTLLNKHDISTSPDLLDLANKLWSFV